MSKVRLKIYSSIMTYWVVTTPLQLCPDAGVAEGELMQFPTPSSDAPRASSSRAEVPVNQPTLAIAPQSPGSDHSLDSGGDGDEDVNEDLADGIRKLSVDPQPYRYHGKSSGLVFIRSALDLKAQMTGPQPQQKPGRGRPPVSATQTLAV